MTTYTPRQIIVNALENIGAIADGQTPSAEDINKGFIRLQWMLSQWQRKRWLIWHLVDLSITATGAQSYTIGPGADIPFTVRPDKLQSAFLRQLTQSQPNQIDYPLELINSWEDYTNIALKQLKSFPSYVFYDSAYPVGIIYPWPVPQASIYALHVQVKELLNQFTSLDQVVTLPEEYLPAMEYNLAIRLAPVFGMPPRPDIMGLAKDALNVLRVENAQIAKLMIPQELIRGGIYNPYSDQIR